MSFGDRSEWKPKGEVRQMWAGGPLRRWSADKQNGFMPYANDGYVGSYVCAVCGEDSVGVYGPSAKGFICSACREASRARKPKLEAALC